MKKRRPTPEMPEKLKSKLKHTIEENDFRTAPHR
jgi:hypothetical protein